MNTKEISSVSCSGEDATEINIHSYFNEEDGVARRDVMSSEKEIRKMYGKTRAFCSHQKLGEKFITDIFQAHKFQADLSSNL